MAARTRDLAEANSRLQAEICERVRAERSAREGEHRLSITAERLRLAVEATNLGIWDVDAKTRIRQWSDEYKAILGLPSDCGADPDLFASLIHAEDREWVTRAYERAYDAASGGHYQAQFRIVRACDGTELWVEATGRVHFDEAGNPVRAIGTLADITERCRTEVALQARTAELETVLDTVPIAVWLAHDPECRRISGNRAAANRLRLDTKDNLSLAAPELERPRHFRVVSHGADIPPDRLPLQRAARGEVVRNDELRVLFDDGMYYDELISASPVRDASGTIIGAVGAAVDITERNAAENQIRRLALHDPLTGLPNRTLFHDRLRQAIARAERRGEHVAVMLLDLDQFKEVNDTLGHLAGDALLCEVADRLSAIARASDTWARLGGDEFVLVQEGLNSVNGIAAMASRILEALEPPFHLNEHELHVAGSLGVTVYPEDGGCPERLIRNADVALYRAKTAGRGRFEPYRSELDREMRHHSQLKRELRRALENGSFELFYQPVFELQRRRLVKAEALLRLRQADGTYLAASAFIPHVENSGLIHQLGAWVLRTACQQAAAWLAAGHDLKIAVNVSPAQLRSSEFPRLLTRLLEENALAPQALELELTESRFPRRVESADP